MIKKKTSFILIFFIVGALNLWSQSNTSFEISPSSERLPILLKIEHVSANVLVEGYEGSKVIITLLRNNKPIKSNSAPINFTEKNNEINLELLDRKKGYQFRIKVPQKTSLDISIHKSRNIEVINTEGAIKISTLTSDVKLTNVVGNIDINSHSGNIKIENLDGSPIIYSTEGEISLSFKKLPKAFSNILNTVSGKIILLLDEIDAVFLRIRFDIPEHHFNLISDFDLIPANAESFPIGKDDGVSIYRTINAGKTPIYIKTFKGTIELKKKSYNGR